MGPCLALPCIGGLVSIPFTEPLGTPCGKGLVCTDASTCVLANGNVCETQCAGCVQPSDCGGDDSPCNVRTCVSGLCGRASVPPGTVCSDAGAVCDGIGFCGLMPEGGYSL